MKDDDFHPFCLRTDCVGLSFSFKGHSNHNRYVLRVKKNSLKWRLFIKTICGKLFLSVTPLHQTCSSNWNPMERLVCQSQPAGLLFQIPVECVFSEHIKGIHDSFLQLSGDAVPFYGSCPGCYRVLVQCGCILYHLFLPVISKQGNQIIWDHSLMNILGKKPCSH